MCVKLRVVSDYNLHLYCFILKLKHGNSRV